MTVTVRRGPAPPVLDGRLSKNEWKHAAVVTDFTQKEPREGAPASERTFVLTFYTDDHIYFGILCFDRQPERIVAYEMRRDASLSDNDYFEIIIDTYHDQRNAYYFATNCLGARLDAEIKAEGAHINWDWDGIWTSVGRRTKHGWSAEVAIPFKTLRFKDQEDLTWGINFARYIARKREEAYWSPVSRDDDYDRYGKFKASKFGVLRGLTNVRPQQIFEVKPYTVGGVQGSFSDFNTFEQRADFGLDAKIHLTSGLVSDITVNTDFAQVEADREQVNLSRFDLFFPEKRDFFLEGLDIFNIGEEQFGSPSTLLFYSRRIGLNQDPETFHFREVPITGGLKVTGKEGAYEIGALNVFTQDLSYVNRFGSRINVPRTNYAAFRLKRDVLNRSSVGIMALSKDEVEGNHYNRTLAADAIFAFDNNLSVQGYVAKTFTPGLKGKDYSGHVNIHWGNDKFSTRARFTDIGENFNPEMGFLLWRDIRRYHGNFTYSPRPNIAHFRQMYIAADAEFTTDHNNQLQFRTLSSGVYNLFQDESHLYFGVINYYDRVPAPGFHIGEAFIPAGVYTYNVFGFSYGSDQSRKWSTGLEIASGGFYNGLFAGVSVSQRFRPTDRFGVDLYWDWNRVDVPFPNGEFSTNVFAGRLKYSFTPNLFAKTYVQWNRFQNRLISNFLLHFIYAPGSDLYLVYNEDWDTSGQRDAVRTLLAKVTYLLNF